MSRPSPKTAKATKKPLQEANGSLPPLQASVPATVAPKEAHAASSAPSKHQTHGGYTILSGTNTSAAQLRRGPNVAKGTIGSFSSLASYSSYLHNLTVPELHRHAVEQARTVPIDDRIRLIKRLEMGWSEAAAREGTLPAPPRREPFTTEQIAAQTEIRKKLLRHLA